MKTAYIIRLKLPLVKVTDQQADLEKMKSYLYVFINLSLPNIIQQTNQDFICYIQHQVEVTSIIEELILSLPSLPSNIIFTTNMRQEVSDHLIALSHEDYDKIFFIKLNYNLLCSLDFLEYVHQTIFPSDLKVLTFTNLSNYHINRQQLSSLSDDKCNAYIYICSMKEYIQHLRLYDYYYPAILDQKYLLFPHAYIIPNKILYLTYVGTALNTPPSLGNLSDSDLFVHYFPSLVQGGAL